MLRFRVFGFPVSVEWFFWLTCFLLGGGLRMESARDLPGILLWTIAVFFSIMVHELGHAFAGRRYGTAPIIHLHGFGGVTMFQGRPFNRRQNILVSAAGPAASLALGLIVLAIAPVLAGDAPRGSAADKLTWYFLWINFFWTIVNLLPILPLDGGQIARDLLGPKRIEITRWIGVTFAAVVAWWAFSNGLVFLGLMLAYLGFMNYQQQAPQ